MKIKIHLLLLLASVFVSAHVVAQTANVVFFSEQGEKFTVVMNALRINDNPETNIRVTDLRSDAFKVKIIFDNTNIPDIDKNVMLAMGEEITYIIKKNKKGEYVLQYFNQTPIAQTPVNTSGQTSYNHNQVPPNDGNVVRGATTSTTTTTMTTTINESPNNVGANVNVGGVSMNVSITDNTQMTGTTTTTYTTTTTTTTNETGNVQPQTGCVYAMSGSDFNAAKASISGKSFEDTKLTVAKQVVDANCLSSKQIKEIMQLFTFEESKLDFAKYAYRRSTDPSNYYQLNDAFTFESSIEELNLYIRQNPR